MNCVDVISFIELKTTVVLVLLCVDMPTEA